MLKEKLRQAALTLMNLCAFVTRRAAELALRDPRTTRVAVGGFLVWVAASFDVVIPAGAQSAIIWLTLIVAFYFAADSKR